MLIVRLFWILIVRLLSLLKLMRSLLSLPKLRLLTVLLRLLFTTARLAVVLERAGRLHVRDV